MPRFPAFTGSRATLLDQHAQASGMCKRSRYTPAGRRCADKGHADSLAWSCRPAVHTTQPIRHPAQHFGSSVCRGILDKCGGVPAVLQRQGRGHSRKSARELDSFEFDRRARAVRRPFAPTMPTFSGLNLFAATCPSSIDRSHEGARSGFGTNSPCSATTMNGPPRRNRSFAAPRSRSLLRQRLGTSGIAVSTIH